MKKEEIRMIPISKIIEPYNPVRLSVEQERLEELAASIKAIGILEPLIVRWDGDYYEIIAGHMRFLAAQIAGLEEVPCRVIECSNEELEQIRLSENIQRIEVDPIEEGEYFKYLNVRYGWSIGQIAELIKKSRQYVSERMAASQWEQELKDAVRLGRISFTAAKVIADEEDDDIRHQVLQWALMENATAAQIAAWRTTLNVEKNAARAAGQPYVPPTEIPDPDQIPLLCDICNQFKPAGRTRFMRICEDCLDELEETFKLAAEALARESGEL
jgi:ParB family chromosome partitioning protein